MSELLLTTEIRENTGKGASRRLRREGFIPSIVYGEGKAATSVFVSPKDLLTIIKSPKGINSLIQLKQKKGSKARVVMLRDFQLDPVRGDVIHADFVRIDLTKPLEAQVPILTEGLSAGVKDEGGVLHLVMRSINVKCLPADIPSAITIDVSGLQLHDIVRIKDIEFEAGIEVLQESEAALVIVVPKKVEPTAEELAAEAEAAEGAEPEEVDAKGKAEDGDKPAEDGKKADGDKADDKKADKKAGKDDKKKK